jgi:hypothetical protein
LIKKVVRQRKIPKDKIQMNVRLDPEQVRVLESFFKGSLANLCSIILDYEIAVIFKKIRMLSGRPLICDCGEEKEPFKKVCRTCFNDITIALGYSNTIPPLKKDIDFLD